MTNTQPNPGSSAVQIAIVRAKDLLQRAEDLQLRIAALHERFGVTFIVGLVLRDLTGAPSERPSPDRANESLISPEMRELMDVFQIVQREVATLQTNVPALAASTLSTAAYAPEVSAIQSDFNRLMADLQSLAQSEAVTNVYRLDASAVHPLVWSNEAIDRLTDALGGLAGYLENGPLSIPRPESPEPTRAETPPAAPEAPIAASELPWPSSDAQIKSELTYSAERDGNPETYVRMLASRLRTPAQMEDFMRVMFTYDLEFNRNGRQRILNQQNIEQNQLWHDPAMFLTTYNADGKIVGDCKSIALAMAKVLQLQGREAFAIQSSEAKQEGAAINVEGHMATIWLETVNGRRVAHRLDTTEKNGADASVLTIQANDGETEAQLITRCFGAGEDHTRLFPDRLCLCLRLPNGMALNLPGDTELLAQSRPLEDAFRRDDLTAALTIYHAEVSRRPENLNLRLGELQIMLLKKAPATDLETIVAGIEQLCRDHPDARANDANFYNALLTSQALDKEGHKPLAERLAAAAIRR